ncbi:CCA tRNA nucleotidyltransferase [Paenibacillaceae bacterium]|nr:CCA tRNA nucleotidyltransferase [Paenibacillaceae bacterium]
MWSQPELAAALPVLRTLTDHHHKAYIVGGAVRDYLAKRKIADVDIATSATPDEVMRLFPRTVPTGLQHGTVTVLDHAGAFEVTTFRKESQYEAFRRPAGVEFISDVKEDLLRRDFTINAMAISPDGKLVDPYGGAKDLEAGTIRCVGEEDARFQEDALRMLRAVRFAAEYGHNDNAFDPATWRALVRHRELLRHVAMERVGVELEKMFKGARPDYAIACLGSSGLLQYTKEKLPLPCLNQAAAYQQSSLRLLPSSLLRWAAWCITQNMGRHEVELLCQRLRYSGKRTAELTQLTGFHWEWTERRSTVDAEMHHKQDMLNHPDGCAARLRSDWIEMVISYGRITAQHWLTLAGKQGWNEPFIANLSLQRILDELQVTSLQELAVNGTQLSETLSRPPGPWLKRCLARLLHDAAASVVANDQQALLEHAQNLIDKERL